MISQGLSGWHGRMPMRNKLVIFIVEGQSEENALYPVMKSFFYPDEVIFYIYHGDLTVKSYAGSTPMKEIESIVKRVMKRYALKRSDIRLVAELTDTDGCFIPDEFIIQDDSAKHIDYSDGEIRTMFKESIEERNMKRRINLDFLISSSSLKGGIPYSIYYFSRNLEHAIYGISGHVNDGRKTTLAYRFSDRFGKDCKAFAGYLEDEGITPEGSYQKTWEAIQSGRESLKRHSNLLLLFL